MGQQRPSQYYRPTARRACGIAGQLCAQRDIYTVVPKYRTPGIFKYFRIRIKIETIYVGLKLAFHNDNTDFLARILADSPDTPTSP